MGFDREAFLSFLVSEGVVGVFPEGRRLSSGRISHWYANCRILGDRVETIERLGCFLLDFVEEKEIRFDCFLGVPEGGTKLAVIADYLKGKREGNPRQPVVMLRGRPKEHGDPRDRLLLGPLAEGDRVVLLEDVVTTGGSVLRVIGEMRSMGVEVCAVVSLVDRMEKTVRGVPAAEEVEREGGVPFYAMSAAEDLLPRFLASSPQASETVRKIEEDFARYGTRALRLGG